MLEGENNLKGDVNVTAEEPAIILRSEKEISDMIQELLGKTTDLWTQDLPTYFGDDIRNQQKMIIIKYCAEKQCDAKSYSLFLIYKAVGYKKCEEIKGQPLVNPETNEFIGCEPSI